MSIEKFEKNMKSLVEELEEHITEIGENGIRECTLKGFVDSKGNLYPMTLDTKVLSKVVEFVFLPVIKKFCNEKNYTLILPEAQNHYPDLTIIDNESNFKYAVDIKTTYRINEKKFSYLNKKYIFKRLKRTYKIFTEDNKDLLAQGNIVDYEVEHKQEFDKKIQEVLNEISARKEINGMTLGAYTGYFKDRTSVKNIVFPYSKYKKHYVLGMLYSRDEIDEERIYGMEEFYEVPSPIYNIKIFFTEKYKIATRSTGSGNTKNIGSVRTEEELIKGKGSFKNIEEFDKFWLNKN